MAPPLKAPFPWFGGKRRVSHVVWERFGDVPNYVEPFAGSLAVLLGRPHAARNETVNDLDCHIANFWRALQAEPDAVAHYADWPVNEADLHARHQWIHDQEAFRERMHADPHHYDVKVAAWWVWGISAWIGGGWCREPQNQKKPRTLKTSIGIHRSGLNQQRPNLNAPGTGVHRGVPDRRRPGLAPPKGMHRGEIRECDKKKRPDLKQRGGKGSHRKTPQISGTGWRHQGVADDRLHDKLWQQVPHLSGERMGTNAPSVRSAGLLDYFNALAARLRRVRVCCGEWIRILGPSPTEHVGITAVFLDPPYGVQTRDKVYNQDSLTVAEAYRIWCIEKGVRPKLRIALCGYDGEHNDLELHGWVKTAWKAAGGYGARNPDNENAKRERIWFSPHCLNSGPLFEGLE